METNSPSLHQTQGGSNIQPVGYRRAKLLGIKLSEAKNDETVLLDPLPGELDDFEGRLIEHHRLTFGERPPWNDKGGGGAGTAQAADIGPDDFFAVVSGVRDSPLVARMTVRGLAADAQAVSFEEHLHTARIQAVMFGAVGGSVGPAEVMARFDALPDESDIRARMDEVDYLARRPPFDVL